MDINIHFTNNPPYRDDQGYRLAPGQIVLFRAPGPRPRPPRRGGSGSTATEQGREGGDDDNRGKEDKLEIMIVPDESAGIVVKVLKQFLRSLFVLVAEHGAVECTVGMFVGPFVAGDIIVRGPFLD